MKQANINKGMQRLMESYKPRISELDVLKFLKKKGFDISAQETKNYADAVAEYLSYDPEDTSLEDWYEGTKFNYPEDLRELPKVNKFFDEAKEDKFKDREDIQHEIYRYSHLAPRWSKQSLIDEIMSSGFNYEEACYIAEHSTNLDESLKESVGDVNDWISIYLKGHPFDSADEMIEYISEYEDVHALEKRFKTDIIGAIEDYFEENLNEALSENIGQDVSEFQKWVDYDMKKYHKISKDTMNKVKKAGLSVVKDQYGDYEVIADRPVKESLEDEDYMDFLHDLSEHVKECARKWKSRGISMADLTRALDELAVRYEDLDDLN